MRLFLVDMDEHSVEVLFLLDGYKRCAHCLPKGVIVEDECGFSL